MPEFEARVKKWGNSCGIVIPKEILDQGDIGIHDKLSIFVQKEGTNLSEFWGILPGGSREEARKIVKEFREGEKW